MAEEEKDGRRSEDATMKMSRKEKRKAAKKTKRQLLRREKASEEQLFSPENSAELRSLELREAERSLREKTLWEERDKAWLESRVKLNQHSSGENDGEEDDDGWEFVVEGPPEIIWQGNEIILKKKKVRVRKSDSAAKSEENAEKPISNSLAPPELDPQRSSSSFSSAVDNAERPISNPLPPPESDHHRSSSCSSAALIESVTPQQVPNFGTEQDKANCPFHLKTGVCRFGQRCNRVHFYTDKSCTLLIKNMYSGPGLAWEQDEGLEYTEEEVERSYEEFYEDVHTEFLKFGEIINFKVCRNGSFHLRGNVYVHFKSLDSAVIAYHSINARYFAGKQLSCEFVNVARWKVAICGEYMKTRFKTCSRGTACNFIHCFRNPGGEYEWSDNDKPPPRYWVKKMIALFGYSDESANERQTDQTNSSGRILTADVDRHHHSRRSRSRERVYSRQSSLSSTRKDHGDYDCRRRDHLRNDLIDEDNHRRKRKVHHRDPREPLDDDDRDACRVEYRDRTRKSLRRSSGNGDNEFRESGSEMEENCCGYTKRSSRYKKKKTEKRDDDDCGYLERGKENYYDSKKDGKNGSSDYGDRNRERKKSHRRIEKLEAVEDSNEESKISSNKYDVEIESRDRWEPEPEPCFYERDNKP